MIERNIFLVGMAAVGKTTIGGHLARLLEFDFVDSDQEIERRAGADISWIFDIEGEHGFRDREQQVLAALSDGAATVDEIVAAVYPRNLRKSLRAAAGRNVRTHLDKLRQDGQVAEQPATYARPE